MDNTIQERAGIGSAALAIEGDFTILRAVELKQQIEQAVAQASQPGADIDLSGVTEIDSAGLQLMVMAKREAVRQGKQLRFVRHSEAVVDLIELCDLAGQLGDPLLIGPKN
ncbi:STAS domain-containing protein [Hydrogenophaga aquatica]